ncbi:MAG: histidine--tRNA ligase, partial [Phycisphaerales bacterium]|nr:histidine--tRNA ligase [Phycisphaerales bacterium]
LKQADAGGAIRALILGPEFRQGGHIVIKDLATGQQRTITLPEFLSAPLA